MPPAPGGGVSAIRFFLGTVEFPLNPESVTVAEGAKVQTFSALDIGDVTFPRGKTPAKVTMDLLLPGPDRQSLPFVLNWQDPRAIADQFRQWQDAGVTQTFLVTTDPPLYLYVFIESFAWTTIGGMGDLQTKLSLQERRPLTILTDQTAATTWAGQILRGTLALPSSYTVTQVGQTLATLAQQLYRDGLRWSDIYNANQPVLNAAGVRGGSDTIPPGTVIVVPGGNPPPPVQTAPTGAATR